jgi:hypothetical protein
VLVKAVVLFLVAMAVIAWIGGLLGKLRLPGAGKSARLDRYCPSCGKPRIGKGPCSCGRA